MQNNHDWSPHIPICICIPHERRNTCKGAVALVVEWPTSCLEQLPTRHIDSLSGCKEGEVVTLASWRVSSLCDCFGTFLATFYGPHLPRMQRPWFADKPRAGSGRAKYTTKTSPPRPTEPPPLNATRGPKRPEISHAHTHQRRCTGDALCPHAHSSPRGRRHSDRRRCRRLYRCEDHRR